MKWRRIRTTFFCETNCLLKNVNTIYVIQQIVWLVLLVRQIVLLLRQVVLLVRQVVLLIKKGCLTCIKTNCTTCIACKTDCLQKDIKHTCYLLMLRGPITPVSSITYKPCLVLCRKNFFFYKSFLHKWQILCTDKSASFCNFSAVLRFK